MPTLSWRLYIGEVYLGEVEIYGEGLYHFNSHVKGAINTFECLRVNSYPTRWSCVEAVSKILPHECREFIKIVRCENGVIVSKENYNGSTCQV